MDLIGRTISHYKIFEKLGEGGMGVVYKAKDTKLKRFVALKFLPPHVTREQTDRARFLQEAQAAAALNHANVCTIHEIHDEGEHPFIVMEHVEGATLRKLIRDAGDSPIPMETVLEVVLQIGEALYTAHDKGVVHRDVKSENIMVSDTGQVKVMDFGLARVYGSERLTKSSSTIGTVAYMSPERIQGQEVDARSDIFSFGVVLYEMLAGRLPFTGEYESSMMYAIVNEEPEPIQKYRSGLSSEMMHVLNRALEKQPADRYQTMSDVLIDLKRLKRDSESTGRKASDFSGSGRPAMAGAQSGISDGADAPLAVAGLHDVQHPSKREDRGGRKSRWVVPGIVGLLMIAAATWIFIIGPRIGTGLTENRIAVAYFENETGDPAFDRLERLTAETLTHELGQLTFLEVVPLVQDEAVVALLNGMDRLEALAERTKAGLVVSGTLFLEDGRLSIRPQVTDMSTQKILRSLPVISGPVNGSRMITEEMIQKILGLLAFKFQNVWTTNFHLTSTTPNYRAWREYNEGCELFFRTEFDEAIARFSRAYEFDPEFFFSRFMMAISYMNNGARAKVDSLIRESVEIRYKLSDYEREGLLWLEAWLSGDLSEELQRSRSLAAKDPFWYYSTGLGAYDINHIEEAEIWFSSVGPEQEGLINKWENYWSVYGSIEHLLGRYDDELRLAQERRERFPESRSALYHELRARIGLGQIEQVKKQAEGVHALTSGTNPGYSFLGLAYELRKHGYEEEAINFKEKALDWYRNRPTEELKTYRRQYQLFDILFFSVFGLPESSDTVVAESQPSDTLFGSTRAERLQSLKKIAETLNKSYGTRTSSFYGRARYGMLMACLGHREEAMEIFDWLDRFNQKYSYGYNIAWKARIAAHLGDLDRAVALVHDAFRKGHPIRDYFHANPTWDPLLDHPGFQEFIRPK